MRQQIAAIDGGKDAEQDRDFDGAGSMEPAIVVEVQLEAGLEIMERDGNRLCTRFFGDLLDLLLERGLTGRGGRGGVHAGRGCRRCCFLAGHLPLMNTLRAGRLWRRSEERRVGKECRTRGAPVESGEEVEL